MVSSSKYQEGAKDFLEPLTEENLADASKKVARCSLSYENFSDSFLLWSDDTLRPQYCSLYGIRLQQLRPVLQEKATTNFREYSVSFVLHFLKFYWMVQNKQEV